MISAIDRRKLTVELREDSLTSAVFDSLLSLPDEIFWHIVTPNIEPKDTSINEIKFWPKFSAENTNNTNFVEPDLFISCKDFDLIVEAKRRDKRSGWENQYQKKDQWGKRVSGLFKHGILY